MSKFFIRVEQPVDGLSKVNFIHYMPDMLSDEEKLTGILVDGFNEPPSQDGKYIEYYYDNNSGQVVYKYKDLPNTVNTQQQLLDNMIVDSLNTQAEPDSTKSALDAVIVSSLS